MNKWMIALLLLSSCALKGQQPDVLQRVCVRYVDEQGFLRGREALFNRRGLAEVRARFRYTIDGRCALGSQGPPQRVTVCLSKSSPCEHDRTTNVWEDQVEKYFERYPGSHRGACTSECSEHKDTCIHNVRPLADWIGWMQEMRAIQRQRVHH